MEDDDDDRGGGGEQVPLLSQDGVRKDRRRTKKRKEEEKEAGGKRQSVLRASFARASAWFGVDDNLQMGVAVRASKKHKRRKKPATDAGNSDTAQATPASAARESHARREGGGGGSRRSDGSPGDEDPHSGNDDVEAQRLDLSHLQSPWFHGRISAQTARSRLASKSPGFEAVGLFLIRQNSRCQDILVLCCSGRPWSFRIHSSPDLGGYWLGEEHVFGTMAALVSHYRRHRGGLPCTLGQGCPRRRDNFKRMSMALRGTFTAGAQKRNSYHVSGDSGGTGTSDVAVTRMEETREEEQQHQQQEEGGGVEGRVPAPNIFITEYASSGDDDGSTDLESGGARTRRARGGNGQRSKRKKRKKRPDRAAATIGGQLDDERGAEEDSDEAEDGEYEIIGVDQFTPWFTNIITVLQLVVMGVIMVRAGLETVSFRPTTSQAEVPVGFSLQPITLTTTTPANMFLGPPASTLILKGAKYNPCMRKDTVVFANLARQREEESQFGCCMEDDDGYQSCGMTLREACPAEASFLGEGIRCPETCATFRLRPCCTQSNGTCQVLTKGHCLFLSGIWKEEHQLCSDHICLKDTCGFSMKNPDEPNQWYRFFTSIFVHAGLIHVFIVASFQWSTAAAVERKCGFLRMLLMYTISCVGGNLVSGIFSPLYPQVGAAGGIFGVFGISLVDLFHSWQAVERPFTKLIYLLVEIVAFFLVGTLPWIDNFAHVGGFIFGMVAAVVFLPYVTFGKFDAVKKGVLLCICIPLLIALIAVCLIIFYEIQNSEFCPACDAIQCVDWVKGLCSSVNF